MGLILSIETSTKVCSVGLHKDGAVLALSEFFEGQSHSRVLIEQINFLINQTGFVLTDIDGIAVSGGPGSYTGLRIGVATAKGLCFTLGKPLLAINTLEAMAYGINQLNPEQYKLCPMIDARRMEVYCCLIDSYGKFSMPTQALVVNETSFMNELKGNKIIFFGNGSEKCVSLFSNNKNALFLKEVYPSARNVGSLASMKFDSGTFEDIVYYEPYYLKEFMSTQQSQDGRRNN